MRALRPLRPLLARIYGLSRDDLLDMAPADLAAFTDDLKALLKREEG